MPDVVAIDVHVHKGRQGAVGTKPVREGRIAGEEAIEHLADGGTGGRQLPRAIHHVAKDGRDAHDAHAAPPRAAHQDSKAA
jgi:hypothetical protein